MDGKANGPKLLSFADAKQPALISQDDLAEEHWLHKQATEAIGRWRRKREDIRSKLETGAAVEPGMRTARIESRRTLVLR